MLLFVIGLVLGAAVGAAGMWFGIKYDIDNKVKKLRDELTGRIDDKVKEVKDKSKVIMDDLENLKNVAPKDMDDALKAIRDKVKELI